MSSGARVIAHGPIFDRVIDTSGMRAMEMKAPPELDLMKNAGLAVAQEILRQHKSLTPCLTVFLVGPGDNGGDALIAASRLAASGASTVAWASRERPGDHLLANAIKNGVRWKIWAGDTHEFVQDVQSSDCLVDGLLGIGSAPPLRGPVSEMLSALPDIDRQLRIAIDVPSGTDAESGNADPAAFRAQITLTTGPMKLGSLFHPAIEFAGELQTLDIGMDVASYADIRRSLIDAINIRDLLPDRPLDGHKGTFGKLLIIGGSTGYRGAPTLATLAALHGGTGQVTLASVEAVIATTASHAPAATFIRLNETPEGQIDAETSTLVNSNAEPSALLIGPGMGRSVSSDALIYDLLLTYPDTPTVIDADGLNALAKQPDMIRRLGPTHVLTPHPGELQRILNLPSPPNGRARLHAAEDLSSQTQAIVVAKGSPTLICTQDQTWVLAKPNPVLAAAGAGDVLAGAIASFLAQGSSATKAARLGVWLHNHAAIIAAKGTDRGVPMDQVANEISTAIHHLKTGSQPGVTGISERST